MGMRIFGFSCALVLALWLPNIGLADVFELRDGSTVTGTVLYESDTFLSVRTEAGKVITVEKSEIVEHRKQQNKYKDYLERKKKVGSEDISGHMELAEWCISKELLEESLFHLRKILTIDPNHEQARAKLGYVRIKGDWYIEGSPEAAAARTAKPKDKVVAPPIELPEDFVEKSKKKREKRSKRSSTASLSGAPRVYISTKEKVHGDKPEFSVANYEMQAFLRSLDQPIAKTTNKESAKYTVKMTVNVSFQRTHMFYGRIPITHIFDCRVSMVMKDKSTGRVVARSNLSMPFSMSAKRPKKNVAEAGYHWIVANMMHRVSKLSFFKKRGAEVVPEPSW